MNLFLNSKGKYREAVVFLLTALAWNQGVYYGGRLIAGSWHHYDLTISLDESIPFVPWTVSIYFACYLFWAVNYAICALGDKGQRERFFCADALAKAVCLIFFLALPTTNIRPDVVEGGLWGWLMKLLYNIDAADNLFPSIHCLVSWFSWIAVRKRKDIHIAYKWFSFAAALAICISTLTTKQHVILDAVAGVALAEICYLVTSKSKVRWLYAKILSAEVRFFCKKEAN